jgi:hypothetical protein
LGQAIVIEHRFRGPDGSGNGGYTCGLVADLVDADAVEVTLRVPPPLDTPLRVERAGDEVRVLDGDTLVVEARPAKLDLDPPAAPPFAEAERIVASHVPDPEHPFPGCFVCGPNRDGDGLRLEPTPTGNGAVVATWRPRENAAPFVWAALDCPGAFAVDPGWSRGVSVLGRLTAHVVERPAIGAECVVVGWPLGADERRLYAGTALWEGDRLLAMATAVWFPVDMAVRDTA